jgi:hypothetical protein
MAEIRVKRSLLIGLVTVMAVALLAVAFLLGRTSGSGHPEGALLPGQPTVVSRPEARSAESSSLSQTQRTFPADSLTTALPTTEAEPALPGRHVDSMEAAAPAPPAAGAPPITGNPSAPIDPVSAAVAKYLADVDQIQPANLSGSPESVATEMATALARGDTSGLDGMIRQTEGAKEKLAALRPPSPCAAHYEKTLESLDDAVGMLRALRNSIQSSDPAAGLASVSARATVLQTRAEALQKEDRALRQRYGLTR